MIPPRARDQEVFSNGLRPVHYEHDVAIQYLCSPAKSQNAAVQMVSRDYRKVWK